MSLVRILKSCWPAGGGQFLAAGLVADLNEALLAGLPAGSFQRIDALGGKQARIPSHRQFLGRRDKSGQIGRRGAESAEKTDDTNC